MKRRTSLRNVQEPDNDLSLKIAVDATKRYAASIRNDPQACPMFPVINEYHGILQSLSYMQGYLAGFVSSMGEKPTKEKMDALVYETLCDHNVRDIAVAMQTSDLPIDCVNPPREY